MSLLITFDRGDRHRSFRIVSSKKEKKKDGSIAREDYFVQIRKSRRGLFRPRFQEQDARDTWKSMDRTKKKKGEGMIEEEESRDGKEEKIVYRDDTEDLNEDEEDGRKKGG